MHAALTPEQSGLLRVAEKLVDSVAVRNPSDLDSHDRNRAWGLLVNAGVLSFRSREDGEPVASGTEAKLLAEAISSGLVTAPFVGNTLAVDLLARTGTNDELVSSISVGETRVGLLLTTDLVTVAAQGTPAIAWDVEGAQTVVGLDSVSGEQVSLMTFELDAETIAPTPTDPTRMRGQIRPDSGKVIGTVSSRDLQRWHALALTLVAADALGAARQTLDNAISYSKERYAYGVPIGSFQALQHLMVEAYVELQPAGALTNYAAWAVDALAPDQALLAARRAKAQTARITLGVAETAMQVFGGIGVTREHIAHLFSRRVIVDRALFGDEDLHYAAIADSRLVAS